MSTGLSSSDEEGADPGSYRRGLSRIRMSIMAAQSRGWQKFLGNLEQVRSSIRHSLRNVEGGGNQHKVVTRANPAKMRTSRVGVVRGARRSDLTRFGGQGSRRAKADAFSWRVGGWRGEHVAGDPGDGRHLRPRCAPP